MQARGLIHIVLVRFGADAYEVVKFWAVPVCDQVYVCHTVVSDQVVACRQKQTMRSQLTDLMVRYRWPLH